MGSTEQRLASRCTDRCVEDIFDHLLKEVSDFQSSFQTTKTHRTLRGSDAFCIAIIMQSDTWMVIRLLVLNTCSYSYFSPKPSKLENKSFGIGVILGDTYDDLEPKHSHQIINWFIGIYFITKKFLKLHCNFSSQFRYLHSLWCDITDEQAFQNEEPFYIIQNLLVVLNLPL